MAKVHETHAAPAETTQGADQQLQGSPQGAGQTGRELSRQQRGGTMQERRTGGIAPFGRDPFEVMQRLSAEMDELFDSFFYGRPLARGWRDSRLSDLWAPEVEVAEEGNQIRVCVDLPGVPKENVKVDVRDGMLTIEGERREERSEGGPDQGYRRSERRYGSFYRSIALPEGAEAENAQARMRDGVLEVTVPTPGRKSRRLEIQS